MDPGSEVISYGAMKLLAHLQSAGHEVQLNTEPTRTGNKKPASIEVSIAVSADNQLEEEGFRIELDSSKVAITCGGEVGCLYGIMELIEQTGPSGDFTRVEQRQLNPALRYLSKPTFHSSNTF
jgi:hypothetical protein